MSSEREVGSLPDFRLKGTERLTTYAKDGLDQGCAFTYFCTRLTDICSGAPRRPLTDRFAQGNQSAASTQLLRPSRVTRIQD